MASFSHSEVTIAMVTAIMGNWKLSVFGRLQSLAFVSTCSLLSFLLKQHGVIHGTDLNWNFLLIVFTFLIAFISI